jgi:hypothetical protein
MIADLIADLAEKGSGSFSAQHPKGAFGGKGA